LGVFFMSSSNFPPLASASGVSRRAIVVLGMHRSGTSAVAGCLQRLGVDFGPRLMPPTDANERGYYEHIDVVNLHDRLMLALDASWDETGPLPREWWLHHPRADAYREELLNLLRRDFASAPLWGIKDPRLCRLLPWWEPVWKELDTTPVFLIVLRDPAEIAASLVRREGFSAAKSHLLWLRHVLEAERWTRTHPRVFLDFESFLAGWGAALMPLEQALGQPWPQSFIEAQAANEQFLDAALRHAHKVASNALPPWVEQAKIALSLGLTAPTSVEMHSELDYLSNRLEEASLLYDPIIQGRSGDLAQQLSALRRQAQWYEAEWQKSRGREQASQARLTRHTEKLEKLNKRIIAKEEYISYMRTDILSYSRKKGLSLPSRLLEFFRRFASRTK
jgi:hypothetical protein